MLMVEYMKKKQKENLAPEMNQRIVERLRAIADEVRLQLLLRLRRGECNVTTLVEETGVGQASVSKHLAVLRRVGIVTVRRQGNQSFYSIKDSSVFQVCQIVCDRIRKEQTEIAAALHGKMDFEI